MPEPGPREQAGCVSPRLTQLAHWGHRFLRECLRPGDCAVDLTAGNGHDCLVLHQAVRPEGLVLAFDLQPQALAATRARLAETGSGLWDWLPGAPCPARRGILLVPDDHARLGSYLDQLQLRPRGIVANLGYLPGGDKSITTEAATSLAALSSGAQWLAPGGRLAAVLYSGHEKGAGEAVAVAQWFAGLPPRHWEVLALDVPNRTRPPRLLLAQKRS